MTSNSNSQPRQLDDISRSTRDGVRALNAISRNSKTSLINRGLVLGLALLAIDALIVSDFQPQVALAVLRESPWMAVLIGTLLNLLPVIIPVLGTTLLVFGALKLCSGEVNEGIIKLGQSFFVFVVAWLTLDRNLVWSPNIMIPVFGVTTIVSLFVGHKWGYSEAVEQFTGMFMVITSLSALGLAFANSAVSGAISRPYASAEAFTVRTAENEREDLIGYALSANPSGPWTTLLTEEGRRIEYVPSQNIVDREVCDPGGQAQFTPWWTIFVRGVDYSEGQPWSQIPFKRAQSTIEPCKV